jgi:membrane protease YdiL (CAAX protease family)
MSGLALDEYLSFALVALVAIPAIFEEVLFRGFFVQGLRRRHSSSLVIVLTAALFGLVHLNPWQFPAAFLLGLLFGWVSWHTGSIVLPMLGHAFNNLLFLAAVRYPGVFPVPGFNAGSAAITFQPFWLDFSAFVCAACALAVLAREFSKKLNSSPAA